MDNQFSMVDKIMCLMEIKPISIDQLTHITI